MLLIHGGLAEDIGADQFWVTPGITRRLETIGWSVLAPDRNTTPPSWSTAADEMAELLAEPTPVIAGSNGVSVALQLASQRPELVSQLILLWPATASEPELDRHVPPSARHLCSGETVRGTTDVELAALPVPTAVMASIPETPQHQHRTVDRLVELIPGGTRVDHGFPESPRPEFAQHLDGFMSALVGVLKPPVPPSPARQI